MLSGRREGAGETFSPAGCELGGALESELAQTLKFKARATHSRGPLGLQGRESPVPAPGTRSPGAPQLCERSWTLSGAALAVTGKSATASSPPRCTGQPPVGAFTNSHARDTSPETLLPLGFGGTQASITRSF